MGGDETSENQTGGETNRQPRGPRKPQKTEHKGNGKETWGTQPFVVCSPIALGIKHKRVFGFKSTTATSS